MSTDPDVRPLRLTRVHLREEHRARSEVIAANLRALEGLGVADVGIADDCQVVAEGLERAEARRCEVEGAPRGGGRPHVLVDADLRAAGCAVHHLDGGADPAGRTLGQRGPSRHHRIEERQSHRHAHAPQDFAAREVAFSL